MGCHIISELESAMATVSLRLRAALWLLLVSPGLGVAQDKPVKTRSFVADFGFVNAAGNTTITTMNLGEKFVANRPDQQVIFTQLLGAVYGSTEGTKTVENYRAQLRLDYKLHDRLFVFGLTGWDRNTFGGVDRRFEETIGLAYKPIANDHDQLDFEAGVSLFQQRNTVAVNGTFDDNFKAGRIAGLYKHLFTKTASFNQSVEYIPNFEESDHWRLNTETALVAPISVHIGIKLSYVVRFDNAPGLRPPPNPTSARFEKSDRFLTAGVTISY
jgi:putative salt-induced outer membrane protein